MRVFRQIIAVGVGAAITFSNAAQSASAQPPAQSTDSSARQGDRLELGPNIRSTSNTASEPTSEPEESIALNPPTSEAAPQGFANIAATEPTKPEQASKPQQAAPASPSTKPAQNVAQSGTPATTVAQQPAPRSPNNVPVPNLSAPTPRGTPIESFPPVIPKGILETNPPASLEPNPNPLQFPTKPEDVRIEQTESITLQQAIDIARRNSQTLQIAEKQLEQSRSAVREQQAALFPDLTFQMNASRQVSATGQIGVQSRLRRNETLPANRQLPANSPEFDNFGSIGLNNTLQLSYDLDIFGRRNANIRAAREQLRFRELDVERQAEQLRFDTAEAYYNLQNSDGQVAIRQASVRNAQQSLRDAEALERAGVGTRFAVLQAQANLANEQQQRSVARRDQRVAGRRLAELLNISQSANLTAADPVEQAGSWRLSLEESIVQAIKNRPELEQQLVQRDISKQQRRSIRAGGLPQVSVSGSYNFQGVTTDNPDPFSTRGWGSGYALQANLTWNIFDGGAVRSRIKQRDADIAIAESRFDQLRNQVRREVEQAYFGLESSFENIETSEAGVLQSREALRLARLRFQAGVGTQTDVIQAETDLTRAERNRLSAIVNYNLGLSSLQRAVSNLPTNNLSDAP